MTRIILCEGKTDAILLSYYLGKVNGWTHNKRPSTFKIKLSETDNQFIGHYQKEGSELSICAVGGKDNFINFYKENIESYMFNSENGETEYKLAFVIDRDDRSTEEIEEYFSTNLQPHITELIDGAWTTSTFTNSFKEPANAQTIGIIIPREKQGALENLLMDAISEDSYKGNLISLSRNFVDDISPQASKIISTERLKLKTKLGVSLAVLYPEKVFSLIDEQLKAIPWERSIVLNECFKQLINI